MDRFSRLTLEIILSTAFGIKADVQTDPDEKLLTKARQSFRFPFILRILGRIPILRTILRLLMRLRGSMGYFGKIALEMIHQRREEGIQPLFSSEFIHPNRNDHLRQSQK